jgi:hypothetical protein
MVLIFVLSYSICHFRIAFLNENNNYFSNNLKQKKIIPRLAIPIHEFRLGSVQRECARVRRESITQYFAQRRHDRLSKFKKGFLIWNF